NLILVNELNLPTNANTTLILKDGEGYFYKSTPHLVNRNLKTKSKLDPFRQDNFNSRNIRRWVEINRPDYKILDTDDYLNNAISTTKIKIEYAGTEIPVDECKYFVCSLSKFKQGQQHPYFRYKSKGEMKIRQVLAKLKCKFIP